MVDSAVAVLAGDELEQRHPHTVLSCDLLRGLVDLVRIPPETKRVVRGRPKRPVARSNLYLAQTYSIIVKHTKRFIRFDIGWVIS